MCGTGVGWYDVHEVGAGGALLFVQEENLPPICPCMYMIRIYKKICLKTAAYHQQPLPLGKIVIFR